MILLFVIFLAVMRMFFHAVMHIFFLAVMHIFFLAATDRRWYFFAKERALLIK
jgi:hypothetical protein